MDPDEKHDKQNDRLAQFHHTISEQLNARLEESPKFFGLLIVVSTGYGYVLSTPSLVSQAETFFLASFLGWASVLWAAWYLAALGYAFRFLQNSQHLIEQTLGWRPGYVPGLPNGEMTGEPPETIRVWNRFWLLPSIYHPHVAGLIILLVVICVAFAYRTLGFWVGCGALPALTVAILLGMLGICWIFWINTYYLKKYKRTRKPPKTAQGPSTA
jgi:hypothetical protein